MLVFPSLSSAQIVVSDDFTAADGTPLAGRVPPVGQAWTETAGTPMTIVNGIIDTTGGDHTAFVPLTQPFDGSSRLFKLTVDFTTLTNTAGYAGISLFNGTSERAFFGHLSGATPSIGVQVNRGPKLYANPAKPIGLVTLLYDFVTGRTTIYDGDTITGPVLLSTLATPGLVFDRLRLQNGSGANIAISSLSGEILAHGPLTIDQFEPDATITLQNSPPLLYWGTSFADQVTITPGFGTVDPSGFTPINVTPGD
ncbi:MAG: hypothetical protein JWO82_2478, partial [Akkermansiaceae bacterium]|nr:hypothetical protein [Akkermansiaceae bacterium]